mgnify:CR=1 FL=1
MICNSCFKLVKIPGNFCGFCGHNLIKIELSSKDAKELALQISDSIGASDVALLFVFQELDAAMSGINTSAHKFVKECGFSENEYKGVSERYASQNIQKSIEASLAGHPLNDLTINSRLKVIDEFMRYESLGKYS